MTGPRPDDPGARTCGDCGLCCKLLGVASMGKAPQRWCRHFKPGAGCLDYAGRPHECVAFTCQWLHWSQLGDEWRPDRSGFILHLQEGGKRLCVEVDPAKPHAWKREPYYSRLCAWSARADNRGIEVVIWIGARSFAIEGGVELELAGRSYLT